MYRCFPPESVGFEPYITESYQGRWRNFIRVCDSITTMYVCDSVRRVSPSRVIDDTLVSIFDETVNDGYILIRVT